MMIAGCIQCACLALVLPNPQLTQLPRLPKIVPRAGVRGPRLATTFDRWLEQDVSGSSGPVSESLSTVLQALFGACQHVASKIATASCDSESCYNELGSDDDGEMLAIDLLAEEVLFDALTATGLVAVASSESDKVHRHLTLLPPPSRAAPDADDAHHDTSPPAPRMYSVALDPLDSCSIIDTNFAVGTIFGVWATPSLLNVTGRQLVAAGACTYGPRTAITLAIDGRPNVQVAHLPHAAPTPHPHLPHAAPTPPARRPPPPHPPPPHATRHPSPPHCLLPPARQEFLMVGDTWRWSNTYSGISEGKLFAPGNLRATWCVISRDLARSATLGRQLP